MQDTHFPSLFFLFRTYSHQCQSCMFGAEQYVAKTFVKRCYLHLLLRVGTPRCRLTFWKSGNPRQALERRRLKALGGKFLNICTGFILWSIARLCTGSEDNGCKFWRYLEFRVCSNGGNTSDLCPFAQHILSKPPIHDTPPFVRAQISDFSVKSAFQTNGHLFLKSTSYNVNVNCNGNYYI